MPRSSSDGSVSVSESTSLRSGRFESFFEEDFSFEGFGEVELLLSSFVEVLLRMELIFL